MVCGFSDVVSLIACRGLGSLLVRLFLVLEASVRCCSVMLVLGGASMSQSLGEKALNSKPKALKNPYNP